MNKLPPGRGFYDSEFDVHDISGEVDLFSDVVPLSPLEIRDRDTMLHACITELETLYVCYRNFREAWRITSATKDGAYEFDDGLDLTVEIERRRLRGRFADFALTTSKNDDPVYVNCYNAALLELRTFNEIHPFRERVKTWDEIHEMKKRHDDEWHRAAHLFFKDEKIRSRIYALKYALDDSLNRHDYSSVIAYIQARVFHHTVHTPAQDLLVDLIFSKVSHVAEDFDKMTHDRLDEVLLPAVHEVLVALGDESFDPNDPYCVHFFTTGSIFKAILTSRLDPA
jgi:hypothetical protein